MKKYNIAWTWVAGTILFVSTIAVFYYSMGKFWFADDDLGTIVNGLIYSKNDFIRVFSSDCRSFIVPINYQRSLPNFLSGFLRPIQNVVFTITHYCAGFDPYAYLLVNALVHACNIVLLFYIALLFLPIGFAFLAGALCAFYPEYAWIGWIASLPNVLSLFFLLLSLLCLRAFFKTQRLRASLWYGASGFLFFIALITRESVVLIPFWILLGIFLFKTNQNDRFLRRCWISFRYTSIFFVAHIAYVLMRMWAFGFESLTRTYNNLFLRFPWLSKFLGNQVTTISTASVASSTQTVSNQLSAQVQSVTQVSSWFDSAVIKIQKLCIAGLRWLEVFFSLNVTSKHGAILLWLLALATGVFLYYAYRNHRSLLIWLLFGIACASWPGVVAYPCSRYLNLMFPFFVFLVVGAVYFCLTTLRNRWIGYVIIPVLCFAVVRGVYENRRTVAGTGHNAWVNSERFRTFWQTHTFDKKVKVILLGSPFVSDIESIFQVGFNDLAMRAAFELFSTYAQQNIFGCKRDYRVSGVQSKLIPIDHGFRFISGDKEHCAMWMQFSDHPIRFNVKSRSYEWMAEQYQVDRWYQSSMGKFKIHEMIDGKYVTDISFVFDPEWIDEKTVFVTWDTQDGKYRRLEF